MSVIKIFKKKLLAHFADKKSELMLMRRATASV